MDAGHVIATLGGRFDPSGFNAFGSAMYRARSDMEAAEKRMNRSQSAIAKGSHAMGQAVKLGAIGGIAGLGVAVGYSIKKAADFEQQLSALGSVSGATARQMAELKKQAMDAGAATKYSNLEAAQAQTELAKGGLSVSQILRGGLKAALALAAAGNLELADAATYTVNAMKLFKLNGDQAVHVADALSTAANQTTADVQDFGSALVQGGGAAKSAGYDFDQTITLLEALAEVGVKNSDAGTSMKTALLQLVGPTNKQAEAAKKAGLSFLDQQGKMKSLTAISAMLRDKTSAMTSAQRTSLFQTLAGTDGFRTLLALYDAGPGKLSKLEQSNKRQGVAAEVAAEKQDNLKGKWENFTGSVETAAITVGDKFLPMLTRGAEQATEFLNHLSQTGQLDRFADGLVHGAEEAIDVVGELTHVVGDVAHAAGPAVSALRAIGGALDLGDPSHVEAILAAIIGFKVAGVVAPMVMELATGVRLLATAPTVGALATDIVAMVNPLTAAAVGVGVLAGALVLLSGRTTHDTQLAEENAAAHKRQADAIKAVHDAERAAADKGLAKEQADIDLEKARRATHDAAMGKGGKKSEAYRDALLDERQASLRAKDAADEYTGSIKKQHGETTKAVDIARKRVAETNKEVDAARRQIEASSKPITTPGGKTINRAPRLGDTNALADAQLRQADAVKAYIQAQAHAAVTDTNRNRLMKASTQITEDNVQGVAQLIDALSSLPKDAKSKIDLAGDQDALARLGGLAAQLTSIGRRRTVTRVLADANSANSAVLAFKAILAGVPLKKVTDILAKTKGTSEVAALKAAINQVESKSVEVSVTTRYKTLGVPAPNSAGGGGPARRAAGRGPIGTERALIGEGRDPREWVVDPKRGSAYRVDAPTIADLSPDSYVIPVDRQYRGRAVGWLSDIARDLGIPGYKDGKAPKKKPKPYRPSKAEANKAVKNLKVPEKVTYAAVPEDELKDDVNTARDNWKKRSKSIKSYEDKVRKDDAALAAAKKTKKKAKIADAQKKLGKDQARLNALKNGGQGLRPAQEVYNTWREERAKLQALQATNRDIERWNTIQETDRQKMANAAAKGDEDAYNAAQTDRKTILGKLKATYEKAVGLAKSGSKIKADLENALATVEGDIQDAETTYGDAAPKQDETEADRIADTGMTDAETARLSEINKDIALAGLTQPLDDDKQAAGEKVDFLTGVLNAIRNGQRGVSNDVIADVADQLKDAKSNLESLVTGNGTNDDSNLQAQIDQANENTRIANENARINAAALATFAGAGDIGTGGANALAAARGGPQINVYTLHPGDSRTLDAIGSAAVDGIGRQPSRGTSKERLGY